MSRHDTTSRAQSLFDRVNQADTDAINMERKVYPTPDTTAETARAHAPPEPKITEAPPVQSPDTGKKDTSVSDTEQDLVRLRVELATTQAENSRLREEIERLRQLVPDEHELARRRAHEDAANRLQAQHEKTIFSRIPKGVYEGMPYATAYSLVKDGITGYGEQWIHKLIRDGNLQDGKLPGYRIGGAVVLDPTSVLDLQARQERAATRKGGRKPGSASRQPQKRRPRPA